MFPYLNRVLFVFCISLYSLSLLACDVCGSAMTGAGVNLLNAHYYNYAGLSWQHSKMSSDESVFDDISHQVTFNMHYYIRPALSVQFNVPYISNVRNTNEESISRSGIGDVSITTRYALLNNKELSDHWSSSLHVGLSLSAPSGDYNPRIYQYDLPEHFNVGNGAWGYGAELLSVWHLDQLGLSLSAVSTWFTKNEVDYRYGRQQVYRAGLFYSTSTVSGWSIVPQLAIQYEDQKSDRYQTGVINRDTGGTAWMAFPGLSLQYDRYHINVNAGVPLEINFNTADDVNHYRTSVQFFILFN